MYRPAQFDEKNLNVVTTIPHNSKMQSLMLERAI